MSFGITDNTAGVQRLAADNSGNWNIGPGAPTANFSVNGHPIVNGGVLSPQTVTSSALTRFVGSIFIPANTVATVSGLSLAGAGSVDQGGIITGFTTTSFQVANPSFTDATYNFSVV